MKWFRMHTSLVDSRKVGPLPDGAFRVYIELLCLAGEKSDCGRTGVSPSDINWRLRRDVSGDVTVTLSVGLVTIDGDGEYLIPDWQEKQFELESSSKRTREWRARQLIDKELKKCDVTCDVSKRHGDALDTDTDTDRDTEKNKSSPPAVAEGVVGSLPCPAKELVDMYHQLMPQNPKCVVLSARRRSIMQARWQYWAREGKYATKADGLAWWIKFFDHASESKFLTGQSPPTPGRNVFFADIEFLFTERSHAKIIEGAYHGGGQ